MAQENQIAPTQNWDEIMNELKRVDRLQSTVVGFSIQVDDLKKQVSLIKKAQDIGQNAEQDIDKKDNVIDAQNKKLKAILTQSQRRRYQNIGKEFVKGAGLQFERIKKAIKLKEQMDTKKEEFTKTVQKVKEEQKKSVKHGGFWKKFLGIVAVLGVAAYIFRDKIAKLLPDLSSMSQGIGSRILTSFDKLLGNLLKYTTTIVGGVITAVVLFACRNLIPNLVGQFFHTTLPIALVASTLAIMSMFSESAGTQLNSLMSERIADRNATNYADAAEIEAERRMAANAANHDYVAILNNQYSEAAIARAEGQQALDLLRGFGQYLYMTQMVNDNEMISMLAAMGDELRPMIQQGLRTGTLNLTDIFAQINSQSFKTTYKTDAERRKAIAQMIAARLGALGHTVTDAQIDRIANVVNNSYFERIANQMAADGRYTTLEAKTANLTLNTSTTQTAVSQEVGTTTTNTLVTNLHIGQILGHGFADSVKDTLISIDTFLNSNNTTDTLTKGISDYFAWLHDATKKHISDNLYKLGIIVNEIIKINQNDRGQQRNEIRPNSSTVISDSRVLMIDINAQDAYVNMIGNTITEMFTHTKTIQNAVKESNTHLIQVNNSLLNSIVILPEDLNLQLQGASGQVLQKMAVALQSQGRRIEELERAVTSISRPSGTSVSPEAPAAITQ